MEGSYSASWKEMERKLKSMKGFGDEEELRQESVDWNPTEKSVVRRENSWIRQLTNKDREGVVKVLLCS